MKRPYHDVPGKLCGCCEGLERLTPMVIANRPGLDALAYRVGTHATFLETMKACLSSSDYPALGGLTTRESTDPSIALLDAWATVADVLTFYQERIANEGYLLTATERRSILELARLVGYKLRPGVAASVFLAFTLEKDYEVEIPAGTRAQSLPGQGELPQSFETSDPLLARAEWNELKPRMTWPQQITFEDPSDANNAALPETDARKISTLYFQGTATSLKPNDPLLFIFKPKGEETGEQEQDTVFRRIEAVEPQAAENRTKVILQQVPASQRAATFVTNVQQTVGRYLDLEAFGVSPDTQMAQRVVGLVKELQTKLTPDTAPERLAILLHEEKLPQLREEHAIAVEGEYARLEPWVGGLVSDLENVVARLSTATTTAGTTCTAGAPGYPGDSAQLSAQAILSQAVGFADLLGPLVQPPSKQPANALQLERTVAQAFAPKADVAPRILTILKPQLKSTLYRAWADAEVTLPSELESAEALRVKAAPLGAKALPKPVCDHNGAVFGYKEWPLLGISVRLSFCLDSYVWHEGYRWSCAPVWVQIALTVDAETRQEVRIRLDANSPFKDTLRGIDVEITLDERSHTLQPDRPDVQVVDRIVMTFGDETITLKHNYDAEGITDQQVTIGDYDELFSEIETRLATINEGLVTITNSFDSEDIESKEASLSIEDLPIPVPSQMRDVLTLDAEYNKIVPQSWVAIERPDKDSLIKCRVEKAETISKANYGKVTQLTLNAPWLESTDYSLSLLRKTFIYAQSESLALAERPFQGNVQGKEIILDGLYDSLEAGRWLIVSGERTDVPGTSGIEASELVMLAGIRHSVQQDENGIDIPGDTPHTTLILAKELAYQYKRDTVTIHGNVVKATHGETRQQVLGSGDGSKPLQQFTLKQSPLTYLAAATPAGADSTLKVRVDEVLWREKDRLVGLGPKDRAYITRTDDEDKTTIIFGDGQHGARLPTGVENVDAVYRTGIGKLGNVADEQISLLATRPLGVKGVINPLRASGGADRESRDQARRNAPLAVMALDRLVSVQDYVDFSRTFAGIGKASAARLSDGQRQVVHVTIAGADDIPIAEHSDLYRHLCQALHQFGDPYQPIQVDVRELMLLVFDARVRLLPDYLWESVAPTIRGALLDAFSFDCRELGQDVLLSEVMGVIQAVRGVAYVDVDVVDAVDEGVTTDELELLADDLRRRERVVVEIDRIQTSHLVQRSGETWSSIAARYGIAEDQLQALNPDIDAPAVGGHVRIPRTIRPAQLAYLSPNVPDTLILAELTL